MRENRDHGRPYVGRILTYFLGLICTATPSFAQKTVVRDAGGGRKLEQVYNAAGQVIEERSLGPDGKPTSKTEYEYRPGYYQQQELVTTYWPDGKIKTVIRTNYDPNANFTLEFAQVYDESGKQIGGHRLTHNPETNVYLCQDWVPAAKDYKKVKCPEGGEGGGGEAPEEVKTFAYEEVVQHLEAARAAAAEEQKNRGRRPVMAEVNKEIGLVLPAQIGAGTRFSGSLTEDPKRYEGVPGVLVVRVTLPLASSGEGSTLLDWEVASEGAKPQPAYGPLTFGLSPGSSELNLTFRRSGNAGNAISRAIDLAQAKSKPRTPHSFTGAAICLTGQLCAVSGPFSGDSSQTFAAFEKRPARIVTETTEMSYIEVPELTHAGPWPLLIAEGASVVALPVVIAELALDPERQDITKGQSVLVNFRLDGPEELPESEWRAGNFPPTNVEWARSLVPGFQMPKAKREEREEKERKHEKETEEEQRSGEILLVLKNTAPQQVTLRSSKNGGYVFRLTNQSFSRGGFSYDMVAEGISSGSFAVRAYVIPFLAPVQGQEFPNKPNAAGK